MTGTAVTRLPHAVVELRGADVRTFANGMFTNNVRDLPVGKGQRTAMVDDRGRVQGLLDLYCVADDRLVCVLEGVDPEPFIERYDAFVFIEDVTFEHRADLAVFTLQGPDAAEMLARAGLPVPGRGEIALQSEGAERLVAERDRGLGGFDILAPEPPELDAPSRPFEALEVARVEAGLVRWPVDFGDKALPHEMGMREAYLHFEKGCYVGQESIHRIEVLGKVRKQLVRLRWTGEAQPPQGAEITHGGRVVGRLTSPVRVEGGGMGLAVLREPASEPGSVVSVAVGDEHVDATVLPRVPTDGER